MTQLAVITQSQYQSLDAAEQEVVRQKLSTILSDLLNDPTEGGNAGKHVVSRFPASCFTTFGFCLTDLFFWGYFIMSGLLRQNLWQLM